VNRRLMIVLTKLHSPLNRNNNSVRTATKQSVQFTQNDSHSFNAYFI